MPIPDELLKEMKCCLSNDGHILFEPILINCGGNACKQCIRESEDRKLNCFNCNDKHERKELFKSPINKIVQTLVKSFFNDLLTDVEATRKSIIEVYESNNYLYHCIIILKYIYYLYIRWNTCRRIG